MERACGKLIVVRNIVPATSKQTNRILLGLSSGRYWRKGLLVLETYFILYFFNQLYFCITKDYIFLTVYLDIVSGR